MDFYPHAKVLKQDLISRIEAKATHSPLQMLEYGSDDPNCLGDPNVGSNTRRHNHDIKWQR